MGATKTGKGKSFPIMKRRDMFAAVHAMGRAGSDNYGPDQLKANIIRIAKAKGLTSELPKAWQSGEDKMPYWPLYIYRCGVKRLTMIFKSAYKALCVLRDRYR
jgi:hypothetical protein